MGQDHQGQQHPARLSVDPTQPWTWSAVEQAQAIASRHVSSRDVVASVLARLDQVNPAINAVVSVQRESALADADAADASIARGEPPGPLHGVPITTKINVDQRGLPTTNGVEAFKALIATDDNPVVANLRKAGAVIIGRTNTPAFSMRWFTENALHGRTLNPWRADRTPGGSSGGASAALAAGIGSIAHGNDGGGSIRYPAYCTGVVGIRPTVGRVPTYNATAAVERPLSMQLISVQGPLARNVADLRLALDCMSGEDPRDPWWVPAPSIGPEVAGPIRVAVCIDPDGAGVDPAVEIAVRQAAQVLSAAGYDVHRVTPPDVAAAAEAWNTFAQSDARHTVSKVVQQLGDANARRAMELMLARTPELDIAGQIGVGASRSTYLRHWNLFLDHYPLVLCPVAMEQALPYGVDLESPDSVARLYRSHIWLFATAFLGLPCASVPTGVANGLPMGVQLIGRRFREDMVLDAAQALETHHGLLTPIDPLA